METIRKQINLSDTRNRYINKKLNTNPYLSNNSPEYINKVYYYSDNLFYDNDETYGGQCVDILVRNYKRTPTVKSKYSWATTLWYSSEVTNPIPMWLCDEDGRKIVFRNGIQYVVENNVEKKYTGNCYFYLRYKNILNTYFWIINTFIPSCKFYRICKDRYKTVNTISFNDRTETTDNPFFSNYNIKIYDELPNLDKASDWINEIICVTEYSEDVVTRFKNLEIMGDFIIFCNYLFNHGLHSETLNGTEINELVNDDIHYLPPYVSIPIVITRNTVDTGIFTPVVEQWIPKKKYYLGDVVYYNGNTYMLNHATEYDISYVDGTFNDVFIKAQTTAKNKQGNNDYNKNYIIITKSKDLNNLKSFNYNINTGEEGKTNTYVYVNPANGKYGIIIPYHCGVYDTQTRITSFVEQTGNNSSGYWKRIEYPYFNTTDGGDTTTGYSAITQSRVVDHKRKKTSVDDNGNLLPFILHYNNGAVSRDTELEFKPGITRESMVNDEGTEKNCDGIESISFYKDDITQTPQQIFKTDSPILYSVVPNGTSVIEFQYFTGKRLGKNGNNSWKVLDNSAVTYKEKYYFTRDTITGISVDGSTKTFDFININLTYSLVNVDNNEDVELLNNNPIYSTISVDGPTLKYDGTDYAPLIKDESLLEVINISSDIDAKITRGISSAFERHHILGEIKTIQDMENFRNNYFEI